MDVLGDGTEQEPYWVYGGIGGEVVGVVVVVVVEVGKGRALFDDDGDGVFMWGHVVMSGCNCGLPRL